MGHSRCQSPILQAKRYVVCLKRMFVVVREGRTLSAKGRRTWECTTLMRPKAICGTTLSGGSEYAERKSLTDQLESEDKTAHLQLPRTTFWASLSNAVVCESGVRSREAIDVLGTLGLNTDDIKARLKTALQTVSR